MSIDVLFDIGVSWSTSGCSAVPNLLMNWNEMLMHVLDMKEV